MHLQDLIWQLADFRSMLAYYQTQLVQPVSIRSVKAKDLGSIDVNQE